MRHCRGVKLNTDSPKDTQPARAIAQSVTGRICRAIEAGLPLFVLVYYDHEADKIDLLDVLRQTLKQADIPTRTFDPAHNPEHGAGKLYPLLAKASAEGCLCLVSGLPLDENAIRADHDFMQYMNLHRDEITRSRIRMVLFLQSMHIEQFMHAAGDLWDFRHGIHWLERETKTESPRLWNNLERKTERLALSEDEKHEIEAHIQSVRPLIEQTVDPEEKARLFLDLAQWLHRRYAYAHAAEVALEGIDAIRDHRSQLRADLEYELGYALQLTNNFHEALRHYLLSLDIEREIGDKSGEGTTLKIIQGNLETCRAGGTRHN